MLFTKISRLDRKPPPTCSTERATCEQHTPDGEESSERIAPVKLLWMTSCASNWSRYQQRYKRCCSDVMPKTAQPRPAKKLSGSEAQLDGEYIEEGCRKKE
jgi:hypothetical protein